MRSARQVGQTIQKPKHLTVTIPHLSRCPCCVDEFRTRPDESLERLAG